MARIACPNCMHMFDVPHSAFVTRPEKPKAIVSKKDYHPATGKRYKTKERTRRTSLAYYYRNREKILARERERRARQGKVHVTMKDI